MKTLVWSLVFGFTLILWSSVTFAAKEHIYVADRVMLGMYEKAGGGSSAIKLLRNGTKLVKLEEKGGYIKVQTLDDKQVGWVRDNYVTSSKPASVQLNEMQNGKVQSQDLSKAIAKYKRRLVARDNELIKLREETANLNKAAEEAKENAEQTETRYADLLREYNRVKVELDNLQDYQTLATNLDKGEVETIELSEQRIENLLAYGLQQKSFVFVLAGILAICFLLMGYFLGHARYEKRLKQRLSGFSLSLMKS